MSANVSPWSARLRPNKLRFLELSIISATYCLVVVLGLRSFPALYGDEYGSLFDSQHLMGNLHAIGYYLQLNAWLYLFQSDLALRLLSIFWGFLSILFLERWLCAEHLPDGVRRLTLALFVLNPFFLQYALQVRFYSFFLACSLLSFWRFKEWENAPNRRSAVLLALSLFMTIISHFFGLLVFVIITILILRKRFAWLIWATMIVAAIGYIALLFIPGALQFLVTIVYRFTNPYVSVPQSEPRGLSLAMLAKIPLTFYFFAVGERLYPLLLWPVLSILLVIGLCGVRGIFQIMRYPSIAAWAASGILLIVALFLVFDPLAPASLQGASPRYAIFALPIFWIVLAFGAYSSRILQAFLIISQITALMFFLFPVWSNGLFGHSIWSYGRSDLINWPTYFREAVVDPKTTCIIVDGRGRATVERYAPQGVAITNDLQQCPRSDRVVLVSNDYRINMVRRMDAIGQALSAGYTLISNVTLFPAQVTVYQRSTAPGAQISPGRLDLPEQDLQLPLRATQRDWDLAGFVRLDQQQPSIVLRMPAVGANYIVSNYRNLHLLAAGTPVFTLSWIGADGRTEEKVMRAGIDTAAWDGNCTACEPTAHWLKRAALVGARGYSDAYREYTATLWASHLVAPAWPVTQVVMRSLLADGTIYIWGLYP